MMETYQNRFFSDVDLLSDSATSFSTGELLCGEFSVQQFQLRLRVEMTLAP